MKYLKYLKLIVFLFCAHVVCGQDLIITVTGDSIKCKIIEIGNDDIQIRFGRSGNVISIKRSEMASYEYNFEMASSSEKPVKASSKEETKKEKPARKSYPPFCAALSAGATTFGSVSFGDMKGFVPEIGADMTYFLNPVFGAGLKLNVAGCNVDFGDIFSYQDVVIFFGAAAYGRFGKDRIFVTAGAGAGGCIWIMKNQLSNDQSLENMSSTAPGGFLSAGVNYMLTPQVGVGLNVQSIISSLKNAAGYERKAIGIGCNVEFNYRF